MARFLGADVVPKVSGAPSSPTSGQVYYDTGTTKIYCYNGTSWVDLTVQGGSYTASGGITLTGSNFTITSGGITDAMLTGSISNSKLATNPLARANHTGTQLASTVSDFDTQVRTSRLDQIATPTASVAWGSQKITGLLDPTLAQDAATKTYVDNSVSGLDAKASVRVAAATNITVSGPGASIDGITLANGDRVLLTAQTAPAENGIYVFNGSATALTRSADANTWANLPSAYTWVEVGSANADTGWIFTVDAGGTLGSTAITITQFSSSTTIQAGINLTKTGNTLGISAIYPGQTSIVTLGTITTGTWTGTTIAVANGGTGGTAASATTAHNIGAMGRYTTTVGDGTATVFTVTHSLGSRACVVQVQSNATPWDVVYPDVEMTSTTTCTLRFAVAPPSSQFDVTVIG